MGEEANLVSFSRCFLRLYRGPTQLTLRKDSGLLVVLLGQNEGVNRKFRLIRRQGTLYASSFPEKPDAIRFFRQNSTGSEPIFTADQE